MDKSFDKNKNVLSFKSGLIILFIILIFNLIFRASTSIYEILYFKTFFQALRVIHDYTLGFLPIPSIYLIAPIYFIYFLKGKFSSPISFIKALINSLLWLVNLFYLLWGFNYSRPSIYSTLEMEPISLDSIYIETSFNNQFAKLEQLVNNDRYQPTDYENEIRISQEQLLRQWGIPTIGKVRVRTIPAGSLLHFRTSGIYIPHALEGHVDKGLFYKQQAFTLAHEMAHGYGITDESECNFIAYLTCIQSENPQLHYSAELAYWRYLAKYYRYYFPEAWKVFYEKMNPIIKEDLRQIRRHVEKYQDLMPVMRDKIYDNYLKSHGVKAGIKSYDQMIQLIAAYNAKKDGITF